MNTKKYNKKKIDIDGELDLLKIFNFLYKKKISILIFSIFVTIISFVYYSTFQINSYTADIKLNQPSNRFIETMHEFYKVGNFNLIKFNSDINIKMTSPVQLKFFLEKSKEKYGKSAIYKNLVIRKIEVIEKNNDNLTTFFVPLHYSIKSNSPHANIYIGAILKDYALHVRDDVISTYIEDIKISNHRLLKVYESEYEIATKLGNDKPYFNTFYDEKTRKIQGMCETVDFEDESFSRGTIILFSQMQNLKKLLKELNIISLSDLEYNFFITEPSSTISVSKSISFIIIPISFVLSLIISSFIVYLKNLLK